MKGEPHRVAEFRLIIGGKEAIGVFREASGLPKESGGLKRGNVVLRRGHGIDIRLLEWIEAAEKGGPEAPRTNCTLELLDYGGSAIATYKLTHAWPSKVAPPVVQAKGTDVAMEELTLSYERLEME